MSLKGSCHCGQVAFEVDGEPTKVLACNCSICSRKGSLLWFVSPDAMRLLTPEDNAIAYLFNEHVIHHRFCARCGIHAYGEGADPSGRRMVAINARCLENFDLAAVSVDHYDGRSH